MAKVLVVDDEPGIRDLLCYSLSKAGFEVHQAGDGAEALRQVDAVQPDVIVLDWIMPGKDGLTTLQELRRKQNRVPVLMLTVLDQGHQYFSATLAGADVYLNKPFKAEEVVLAVQRILDDRQYPSNDATG